MGGSVRYSRDGEVAVLTVDNPPVNALSRDVRAGLAAAIEQFESDAVAKIAVVVGEGRLFIGGADITEFGKPRQPPSLPEAILVVEECHKPVVAAIHGSALGGGLEVALGAHYRVALAGAKLGLPEVSLGLLPGAGGTQRLPRLIGVEAALDMITQGRPVTAEQGLANGMIDRVVSPSDLSSEEHTDAVSGDSSAIVKILGVGYARELLAAGLTRRATGERVVPAVDANLFDERRAQLTRSARGQVAPLAAVDAVQAATRMTLTEGLAEERRLFLEMLDTPQRAGMIHAFFAERRVAKLPELRAVPPRECQRVGVIGGGTMGSGIATTLLLAGLDVTLVERDAESAARAHETVSGFLAQALKRGKLSEARLAEILASHFQATTELTGLSDVDMVIEAVFEDMSIKQDIFSRLDSIVRDGAVLATNTSYLDVNVIAAATSRPADVIGLHFFSPAHVMKLLEVVVADATAPDVTATGIALAKRLGKVAVRAGVCDGFIGNRILAHYRAAADHMVLDGAHPYQIDEALRDFGFAMGPYEVSDLAGLDIGYATRQRKADTRHSRERVPTFADALAEAGRLGQKSSVGYYRYAKGERRGTPDPELDAYVDAAREAAGISPREFAADEIVRRYMAAMINEGARVVEEGIAQRPLDIDVVFVHGYGFPRYRGGPMKYADTVGLSSVLEDIQHFAEDDNHFWQPAALLEQLVRDGRTFQDINDDEFIHA